MGKMFKVLQREYLTVVRKKSFIIGTIIAPVIMVGFIVLPIFFTKIKSEKQKTIYVIDRTGVIYEEFENNLSEKLSDGGRRFLLKNVKFEESELRGIEKDFQEMLRKNKIDGYINISKDIFEKNIVNYYARTVTNFAENSSIRNALNSAVVKMRILNEGFEHSTVMKLTRRTKFEVVRISESGKKEGGEHTFAVAYILMFILYMALILYGTLVMRSVMDEKTSRVIEVLMSSLKPFDLMGGKILGMGLVGLTQFFVWVSMAILVFSFGKSVLGNIIGPSANIGVIPYIEPMIFVYLILFFILGYFLYSGLFAFIGSAFDNEADARPYSIFVMMPLIIPMLMMSYVIGNPDSSGTIALSMIPFTSPIIMLIRICVSSVTVIEILGMILIIVVTIIAEIWVVARIYRVGILMYGKKPGIREILKWVRYS